MANKKEYTIIKSKNGRDTTITGTLDYLKDYFSYTIECGASWNSKINDNPKTIRSLMTTLTKSYDEVEGSCFNRTSIKLKK